VLNDRGGKKKREGDFPLGRRGGVARELLSPLRPIRKKREERPVFSNNERRKRGVAIVLALLHRREGKREIT